MITIPACDIVDHDFQLITDYNYIQDILADYKVRNRKKYQSILLGMGCQDDEIHIVWACEKQFPSNVSLFDLVMNETIHYNRMKRAIAYHAKKRRAL